MRVIQLPPAEPLRSYALKLKEALPRENRKEVQSACNAMIRELAGFYQVKPPPVSILSVRPRKETERWVQELFGDYDPETTKIRLWMRTAIQKKPTSYGVLLSTFCHEFFHHLDIVSLGYPNSYHTRGFYERVGLLYHHIQDTPVRNIVWIKQANGTFRVDWAKTMATGTAGKQGEPGKPGEPGKAGEPGKQGKSGEQGKVGKAGQSGEPGNAGRPGKVGKAGEPGEVAQVQSAQLSINLGS